MALATSLFNHVLFQSDEQAKLKSNREQNLKKEFNKILDSIHNEVTKLV
jgi:hypothetical protein